MQMAWRICGSWLRGAAINKGWMVLPPTHARLSVQGAKRKGPATRREEHKTGGISVPAGGFSSEYGLSTDVLDKAEVITLLCRV